MREQTRIAEAGGSTFRSWTYEQLAEALGLHPVTVRRMVGRGELPSHRFGTAVRFTPADLRAIFGELPGAEHA